MGARVNAVGLDFGTTNSAIAIAAGESDPRLASFAAEDGATSETIRSILFFDADEQGAKAGPLVGHQAIARYVASGANGRLIQSLKSFLADRLFHETNI